MAILHSTAVGGCLVRSAACREVRQAAFVSPAAASQRHGARLVVPRVLPAATEVITAQDKSIIEALERKFKIADVDGNGSIDREELRNLLESTDGGDAYLLTQHWYPEEELDRIMALYDKDSSGSITLDEFQQLVYDGLLLENKLEEYEEAFNAVDTSRNGTIGAMELGKVFAAVGEPMSYEKLVDIMQKYDKDESGQIDFPEFLLMCRDNLIDFKDLQKYVSMTPKERAESEASLVEADSGDLMLIFSESELDEIVASASAKGKLVVVFGALTWCRPCKGVQRPVQRMAELYKDSVTFVKLFGNANNQTKLLFKDRFKVRSTPCFIAIRDGQVIANRTGANKEKLEAFIRELIPADKLPTIVLYPPGYQ